MYLIPIFVTYIIEYSSQEMDNEVTINTSLAKIKTESSLVKKKMDTCLY